MIVKDRFHRVSTTMTLVRYRERDTNLYMYPLLCCLFPVILRSSP
jgi:hypothetical protein